MAKETYPETTLLKQVKGVGDLIALAFVLTLEDPHRFRKSRDVGCFVAAQALWRLRACSIARLNSFFVIPASLIFAKAACTKRARAV
jgi:hypothetical protein